MANSTEEIWEKSKEEDEEEEEEDGDLSLCDLPVIDCLKKTDNQSKKEDALAIEVHEEFDFLSRGGSLLKESEMCAADEVFFKGQILPLRLSVSSDSGLTLSLTRLGKESSHNINSQCLSRSGSMDHGSSTGGFTSNNSSRSSSTRSHNSSSSSSSNTTNKRRVQNNFLSCPSPKPQLRVSSSTTTSRSRSSSTWDLFRLGLVPTPEIELQDLKVRRNSSVNKNSVSRNSSTSSSSKSSRVNKNNTTTSKMNSTGEKNNHGSNIEKQRRPGFLEKKIGGFLSGCKCTDETVSSSNVVIIKSSNNNVESSTTATHAKKEMKTKKKQEEEKQQQQQQGKQAMSRHRTFEWVKDLSHAGYSPEISQNHEQFPRMPVFF